MKVGFVVPGGFDRSGRERIVPMIVWLVERLARRHEVHVFVVDYYREPCSYELVGAMVHDLGRVTAPLRLRRLSIARKLSSALRQHGPFDLLHAYWGIPSGVVTTRVARTLGVPTVVTMTGGELVGFDDIEYGSARRWLDRREINTMIRRASALVVPTVYMAKLAAERGVQTTVINDAVDPAPFPLASRTDGPPWRLVRVASINRVKDYPTLLHALPRVRAALPHPGDIHLDVVGEDTLGGSIQAMSDRLGLSSTVTFHGFQPTDRLGAFYGRAHLNVVSSRHEASNVTMIEAACTGLATVGTAVGHVADWQPDRAVAVPAGDPEALARSIVDLLRDPDRREQIGRAARAWALAHDADWAASEVDRLYASLVTRQPLQAP